MPIIKHIAIHKSPLNLFHYIVNGDKTDEMKYVTGWNCSENPDDAYEEFRDTFEYYSGERFYKKALVTGKIKFFCTTIFSRSRPVKFLRRRLIK